MINNQGGKYNASYVAAYIVKKFNKNGDNLDHLKLQKLLYFIALRWIDEFEEYPYKQPIEMWKLGPVIRDVYSEYRSNGSGPISKPASAFIFEDGKFRLDEVPAADFTREEVRLVERVVQKYGHWGSFELVDETHEHEPWKRNEKKINKNDGRVIEYSSDDLEEIIDQL
ncbi:Panacea domain-containing protein [Rummeliibacillus sp. BSL5]